MKTKHILLIICCLLIGTNVEAQFLKKLKEKAAKAAERTIFKKTDEEDSTNTEKTIDGITKNEDSSSKNLSKKEKAEANKRAMSLFGGGLEGLPETYTFSYLVNMQISSNKDKNTLQYYVEPNAAYFGNAIPQDKNNSVIVYDMKNEAMVTFMNNDSNKMAMKMRLPFSDKKMQALMKKESENTKKLMNTGHITTLPDKTILGYGCKGYKITQEDGVSSIWFTNDAPVSFIGMFASLNKMPKNLSGDMIPFGPKSMMLEMIYTSNKRKKDNVHMLCTGIEKRIW